MTTAPLRARRSSARWCAWASPSEALATLRVMPVSNLNRTITQIVVTQAGAGSTDLVAIPGAGLRIFVVSIVLILDAAGTVKFTEGTGPTDLTGAIPVATNGGFVVTGNGYDPVLQTNTANSKLSMVSATGKAFGWLRYFIAPE